MSDMGEFDEAMYCKSGRCLFRNVIRRAQLEAEGVDLILTTRKETKEELRREATEWLTTESEDLREVWELCEFEGVSLQQFIGKARERYGSGN